MNDPETSSSADSPAEELLAQELAALLRRAREASGLTQEEVAKRLFLSADLIRNVDEGCFEGVPNAAYMKGYLRSYARLVDLSGDDVVARYGEIEQPVTAPNIQFPDVTQEEVGSVKLTGPVATTGFYGLAAIAVILLLIWGLSIEESPDDSAVPDATVTGLDLEPDAGEAAPAPSDGSNAMQMAAMIPRMPEDAPAEDVAGAQDPGEDSTRTITGDQVQIEIGGAGNGWRRFDGLGGAETAGQGLAATPGIAEEAMERMRAGDSGNVTVERHAEGDKRIITVRAGGSDHLAFAFDDECWLEVSDGDSKSVYADLNRRGDVVDLYGQAPFNVLVGRAQSVTIQYNGRPVELIPNALNNTARIELGDREAQ